MCNNNLTFFNKKYKQFLKNDLYISNLYLIYLNSLLIIFKKLTKLNNNYV